MKDVSTYIGFVKDGKLIFSDTQRKIVDARLKRAEGKDVRLSISEQTKARSTSQNRYMWGVVYEMIAEETGYTTEEIHEFMKNYCLPRQFMTVGDTDQILTKSTTTLSTEEMEKYLSDVRVFAAQHLSLIIPLPNEVYA